MSAIEEPKRAPSAYWLYVQATRQAVQKDIGCRACCQVARTQSERWKNIPAAAKEKYKKQAAELKAKHEKDVAAFKKAGGVVGERFKARKHAKQAEADKAAKKEANAGRPATHAGGAWGEYLRRHRARLTQSLPAGGGCRQRGDVMRAAGKEWTRMSAAARRPYEAT